MAELVKGLLAERSIVRPVLDRDSIEKLRVSADSCSEGFLTPQICLVFLANGRVSGNQSCQAFRLPLKS